MVVWILSRDEIDGGNMIVLHLSARQQNVTWGKRSKGRPADGLRRYSVILPLGAVWAG